MSSSLCLQNTYESVECGLFDKHVLQSQIVIPKRDASRLLVPTLDRLLKKHNVALTKLAYIAVNQGPGPFTTLRTVIATVNGISFAQNTPLIGLDGLRALLSEHAPKNGTTVALLNAFNKEVYFGIQHNGTVITTGYKKALLLFEELRSAHQDSITFIGSGVQTYRSELIDTLGTQAIVSNPLPLAPSLTHLNILAQHIFSKKEQLPTQLFPLYLKTQNFDQIRS